MIVHRRVTSPVGPLLLAGDDTSLLGIWFESSRHPPPAAHLAVAGDSAVLRATEDQLAAYFAGCRRRFELPLAPAGTPFQRTVWTTLADIPFGATWSYAALATRLGHPAATRAVGAANGRNPLPIVLPCHRVVGADGGLTGFGGGLGRKAWLLRHEGARPAAIDLFDTLRTDLDA